VDLEGLPGGAAEGQYTVRMGHVGPGPGASGWTIALRAENASIGQITTRGTDAGAGITAGYERNELTIGPGNEGAVSTVLLAGGSIPVTLPANVTASIVPDGGRIFADLSPADERGVLPFGPSGAVTFGWINSLAESTPSPESVELHLVRIYFRRAAGALPGVCSPLVFVDGLGETPVVNLVTDEEGESLRACTTDGEVCVGDHFVRGDANASGGFDLSDGVFISSWLFVGGPEPSCLDAADVDDSGRVELTDAVALFGFLFLGRDPPPPPFPGCGVDPTDDRLGCARFDRCNQANGG